MKDPSTPLPLPQDEFVERTSTSLKLMFSQMLLFWTTLWAGERSHNEQYQTCTTDSLEAKLSILFFFRRLVLGLPGYIKAWWFCFAVVLILYLASMASNFLTCYPLTKYWSASKSFDVSWWFRLD